MTVVFTHAKLKTLLAHLTPFQYSWTLNVIKNSISFKLYLNENIIKFNSATLKDPPRILTAGPDRLTTAPLFTPAAFECVAEGNPTPTYKWVQR